MTNTDTTTKRGYSAKPAITSPPGLPLLGRLFQMRLYHLGSLFLTPL